MSEENSRRNVPSQQKASELLTSHGIDIWPVDVESVVRAKGIKLRYEALDDELSGMCFYKNETPVICVNAWHTNTRQRFTIAHELGHISLHDEVLKKGALVDKTITILHRDASSAQGTYRIEVEANQFAANLLMPEKFIRKYLREAGLDYGVTHDERAIEEMAKAFQVSTMAMAIRIGNLSSVYST